MTPDTSYTYSWNQRKDVVEVGVQISCPYSAVEWIDAGCCNLDQNFVIGGYLTIFLMFGAVFRVSMAIMGVKLKQFITGFVVLFLGALLVFIASGWKVMEDLNVEAPLLALLVGLVISNLVRMR